MNKTLPTINAESGFRLPIHPDQTNTNTHIHRIYIFYFNQLLSLHMQQSFYISKKDENSNNKKNTIYSDSPWLE